MNYQPRSTNPYIMEKKLNECVGGGGLDPSVLKEINDKLALKQPLSNILTQLVDSQIKHYKINRDISNVSALRSFLVDATVGDGIEISSIKNASGGGQVGLMITAATSSTYYAGIFFGYYLDDFVYFTRAGETSTIKIYKFTKTLQS